MKANELMTGDWVLWMGKPCIVDVPLLATEFGGKEFEDSKYVKPILLTTEILEKNGFVNDFYESIPGAEYYTEGVEGYSYYDNARGILITVCGEECEVVNDLFADVTLHELKYVHELQHAIRLCGIEKEVVL